MATPVKTDILQFMSVRSSQSVDPKKLLHFYIEDVDTGNIDFPKKIRNVFSLASESEIGQLLYTEIFCYAGNGTSIPQKNKELIGKVLGMLESKTVECNAGSSSEPLKLNTMEQGTYIVIEPGSDILSVTEPTYFIIPDKLDNIVIPSNTTVEPSIEEVLKATKSILVIIEKHTKEFNKAILLNSLKQLAIFNNKPLFQTVFTHGNSKLQYAPSIGITRSLLFDTLYKLYILRRIASINLENIINAIQAIHVLEWLAFDEYLKLANDNQLNIDVEFKAAIEYYLRVSFDELKDATFEPGSITLSIFNAKEDLIKYYESTPVMHPIVAKLHWYVKPFNNIKPIGIGDLQVVKQWLCGYKAGEISHIHNIMKNEKKERSHRHLEKNEEIFSFSSEQTSETQRESQTTDRFEVKREAEIVIKTDINIGANTNFTYKNNMITASVGANFAYANSNQFTQRSTQNFARDVMNKAVSQVQNKVTQNRSSTNIFETEETNKHGFDNTQAGATHISGIYRWLDKKYKAQLYNYGKRLMFEFILPEPGAFYVMSKLKASEFEMDVPQRPDEPEYMAIKIKKPGSADDLAPEDINNEIFNKLRIIYDLEDFSFPEETKVLGFINSETNNNFYEKTGLPGSEWYSTSYLTRLDAKDYELTSLIVEGAAYFRGKEQDGEPNDPREQNIIKIFLDGSEVFREENNRAVWHQYNPPVRQDLISPHVISNENISLMIGLWDGDYYNLTISGIFTRTSKLLSNWQFDVFKKIQSVEQKRIEKINQELEITYNSKLSNYYNKLGELNAQAVNDLIQGKSEAFNSQIIREELKKHCVTMIANEFDSNQDDDLSSNKDALSDVPGKLKYQKFSAGEQGKPPVPFAEFKVITEDVKYPKINLEIAKEKAKFIQFLEQAFEWQQIAYIFYPYFWSHEAKWIELMNRLDYTDNSMTAFLKAGSARVLLAVTPAYNEAVMHFLATREPWEGGPLPVIGDPFFIPIHEEIRKQQDDLQNAVPEGESWEFEVPTSLIYLHDSSSPLPNDLICDDDKDTTGNGGTTGTGGSTGNNTHCCSSFLSCIKELIAKLLGKKT